MPRAGVQRPLFWEGVSVLPVKARRKSGPGGRHVEARRRFSATAEAWELMDRARGGQSWAGWARERLVRAAAAELGLDPEEAVDEATG